MRGYWACGIFLTLIPSLAVADGFYPLYRNSRVQAMGGAFTGVADDDAALFFNPAGLAGIKNMSIRPLAIDVEASQDFLGGYNDVKNSFNGDTNVDTLNGLVGKHYYGKAQAVATFLAPKFAISYIYDAQMALRLKNGVFPKGILGLQTTQGVQVGFGVPIAKLRRKKGELRFGMAAKVLSRSGGYQNVNLSDFLSYDLYSITNQLKQLGTGFGLDAGLQYVHKLKKGFQLQAGIAIKDLGDTSFAAVGASPIKQEVSTGLAGIYEGKDTTITVAYDYAHAFEAIDWGKKNHLGLEVKVPLFRFSAGLNQIYPTYGVGLELGLVAVRYVSYAEEQGAAVNLDPERRSLVHFSLKLDL